MVNINSVITWAVTLFVVGLLGYVFYLLALKIRSALGFNKPKQQTAQEIING